ncbi:MAG: hypothetical protein COB20_11410 [SAR86 cluster bacterium]|uniref:Uncharacterized protein n=1 Tax=SAR86 cluster bacterium TaxID=2030880 RepID=A0A2A4X214_9GAMM|nr:MAG: hypothetical protein COB20_11410 [SAR86 cluster bacterium]
MRYLSFPRARPQAKHDETLPKQSVKVAHFCSMKISQEVREYATKMELEDVDKRCSGLCNHCPLRAQQSEIVMDDFFSIN